MKRPHLEEQDFLAHLREMFDQAKKERKHPVRITIKWIFADEHVTRSTQLGIKNAGCLIRAKRRRRTISVVTQSPQITAFRKALFQIVIRYWSGSFGTGKLMQRDSYCVSHETHQNHEKL